MSTLGQIREALAVALADVPGLHVPARRTQIHPPQAVLEFERVDYHDTMMNEPIYTWAVTVLVALNDIEAAQRQIDDYVDPSGVRAALESDPTLGGAVDDVTVRAANGPQRFDEEGTSFLGVRFEVEVRA